MTLISLQPHLFITLYAIFSVLLGYALYAAPKAPITSAPQPASRTLANYRLHTARPLPRRPRRTPHPGAAVPEYAVDCDCRKPKPGMIFTACRELGIDAAQSFMVGDKPRDVECGEAAGAKGVLYEGGSLLACVKRAVEQR